MMIPVDAFGAHNWDMSKNVRRGTNRTANPQEAPDQGEGPAGQTQSREAVALATIRFVRSHHEDMVYDGCGPLSTDPTRAKAAS